MTTAAAEDLFPAARAPSAAATRIAVTRPFSTRGFASFMMTFCFLLLLVSGLVLYVAPRGRTANWTGWQLAGLSREQWFSLHINVSLLFLVMTILHLAMNWSRLVGYIKRRRRRGLFMKKELFSAVALTAAIFVGATWNLPPFHSAMDFRHWMRNYWESVAEEVVQPFTTRFNVRS